MGRPQTILLDGSYITEWIDIERLYCSALLRVRDGVAETLSKAEVGLRHRKERNRLDPGGDVYRAEWNQALGQGARRLQVICDEQSEATGRQFEISKPGVESVAFPADEFTHEAPQIQFGVRGQRGEAIGEVPVGRIQCVLGIHPLMSGLKPITQNPRPAFGSGRQTHEALGSP